MNEISLVIIMALVVINILLVAILLLRNPNKEYRLESHLLSLEKNQEKTERMLREEITKNREETNHNAKQTREEMSNSFKLVSEMLLSRMTEIATLQKNQLDVFSGQLS